VTSTSLLSDRLGCLRMRLPGSTRWASGSRTRIGSSATLCTCSSCRKKRCTVWCDIGAGPGGDRSRGHHAGRQLPVEPRFGGDAAAARQDASRNSGHRQELRAEVEGVPRGGERVSHTVFIAPVTRCTRRVSEPASRTHVVCVLTIDGAGQADALGRRGRRAALEVQKITPANMTDPCLRSPKMEAWSTRFVSGALPIL
jgi:hypothetical protein